MTLTVPQPLMHDLSAAGYAWPWHESPESTVDAPGCYALLIGLKTPVRLKRPEPALLAPGWYIYAGSAHGPGGIRARLTRHFRKRKPVHWHVDQLTRHASALAVHDMPHGEECDLVANLCATYAFDNIEPGFGSSDCQLCPSHLLHWRPPEERPC
ncbi:MAG: hypothetical protein Kow0032_27790 [Methyloligellaceae bacterium]